MMLNESAFGVMFVPCVGFASGVAATAFAANKRKLISNGAAVATPLASIRDPRSLLIGGIFGAFGFLLFQLAKMAGINCDIPALIVFLSNVMVRFLFGNTGFFGRHDGAGKRHFLLKKEDFVHHLVLGLGFSLGAAYITHVTGSALIPFCISAALLLFACCGVPVPGTHHITIVAGYATVATGNIWIGIIAGIIASIVGAQAENIFNTYNDTHIDPPAFTIALGSLIIFNLL